MSPQNLLRKQGVFLGALTECPEENPLFICSDYVAQIKR